MVLKGTKPKKALVYPTNEDVSESLEVGRSLQEDSD